MKVKRGSLGSVVGASLIPTQKTFYGKVRGVLGKAGVDLRYKNQKVTGEGVRKAFKALKDAKLLKSRVAAEGAISFGRKVRAAEAKAVEKPSDEKKPASKSKVVLRERLMEEEKKKEEITKTLNAARTPAPTPTVRPSAPPPIAAPPPIIQKNPVARPMPEKSESELDLPL